MINQFLFHLDVQSSFVEFGRFRRLQVENRLVETAEERGK